MPEHLITDAAYLKGEEEFEGEEKREIFYQMFHASVDEVRIASPTVHLFGRKDKWRLHSVDVVKLCQPQRAQVVEHDGGHEVPKSADEDICDAIEAAYMMM